MTIWKKNIWNTLWTQLLKTLYEFCSRFVVLLWDLVDFVHATTVYSSETTQQIVCKFFNCTTKYHTPKWRSALIWRLCLEPFRNYGPKWDHFGSDRILILCEISNCNQILKLGQVLMDRSYLSTLFRLWPLRSYQARLKHVIYLFNYNSTPPGNLYLQLSISIGIFLMHKGSKRLFERPV